MALLIAVGQPVHAFAPNFDWPVVASSDPLHLRAQKFSTGNVLAPYDAFHLSIENGRLTARLDDAYHIFEDLEITSFEQNPDAVIVVLKSGDVVGIDRHLLGGVVFRAPVPVFQMKHVDVPAGARLETVFVDEEPIRALYDHAEAPLAVARDRAWKKGNVLIIQHLGGKREIIDEIPYSLIADEFAAQEYVLRYWTDLTHPYGRRRAKGEGEARKDWPSAIRAKRNATIDWPSALVIQSLDQDTLERLTGNAEYWTERAERERDQFRVEGEVPAEPLPSLESSRRRLTPRAMTLIAAATLGGTALAAAGARYGFGMDFAHAVHASFANWVAYVSPVLVDAKYRHIMFKSALWMSLVPAVVWGTATIVDRTVTKLGSAKLTLALGGMRAMGYINEPFWRRMADLLRQPHVVRALSLGLNPREIVQPHSALGRLAELDAPTRMGWISSRQDNARTQRLVRTIETQQAQRFSFARWLALTVVSEEQDLDPATVAVLMESKNPAARRALEFTPEMHARHVALTHELTKELAERPADFDVTSLDRAELFHEMELAREAVRVIADRTRNQKIRDALRYRWESIATTARRGLYDFGRPENTFWKTAQPKLSLAEQNASMFNFDYYVGMAYTYLFGDRAKLDHPESLVARDGAPFSTNPQARFGIIDTARWYAINMPAMLTAIYQRAKVFAFKGYDAREELQPTKLNYRGPGFRRSVEWWVGDFVNASDGEYGEIVLNRLKLSTKMMQTTYLLTTMSRVILAGASFVSSSQNYLLHLVIGHLWVGLVFDAIVPTNERMEKRIAKNKQRTEAATGKIERTLRMNDPAQWTEGMQEALALYQDPQARPSAKLLEYHARAKTLLEDSPTADQARELMWSVMREPPLPGKEPKWIKHVATVMGVIISTRLGIMMDVLTFKEGLDWSNLLMTAGVIATMSYSTIWGSLKAWRTSRTRQRHDCEEALLTREERAAVTRVRERDREAPNRVLRPAM